MDKKEKQALKKEFQKKCVQEHNPGYGILVAGAVITSVACAMIFVILYLDLGLELFQFPYQISAYCGDLVLLAVGIVLDVVGEKKLKLDFEDYVGSKRQ